MLPGRPERAALLATVLLGAGGCFAWKQPAGTVDRPTILSFDIDGTHAVSADELRERLVTQASGRVHVVVPDPQYLDQDALGNDRRRIVRYYQERGYYHASVDAVDVVPDGQGYVRVKVHVTEGPPVHVSEVNLTGLEAAPDARKRLASLPLKVGDVFTVAAYDATRAQIEAALHDTGWAHATVTEDAQVDPDLNLARVTYAATPGERFRFGPVFVGGAAAIPRGRIREEAEVAIEPGATFDASALPKAQRRVFDLGVFGGVRVSEGPVDQKKKAIPVVVSVREAPFRTVRAGPGFMFQGTRWEADAIAGWQHRNWLGGLRKLNLDLRAGYAWLPNRWASEGKSGFVGLGAADFTQPEFFTHYLDLNVHAELERGRELAYDFYAERLRLGVPFRLGRLFTLVPSINFELYQLEGQVTVSDANQAQTLQLATCPGKDPSVCLLSYFEERLAIDVRDDPLNTTRGFYLGVTFQQGFTVFQNGVPYLSALPEARAYFTPLRGVVLAARLRMGVMDSFGGDLPLPVLFTSGGSNYMRGYYTRELAPVLNTCPHDQNGVQVDLDPAHPCQARYVPIGGRSLVDGGVELRYPISGELGGVAFLDFGNVRWAPEDLLALGKLQYAAGLGLRYKTVLGPVGLDVAARLPNPDGGQPGVEELYLAADNGRTVLKPTGREHHDPIVSVHLSVGQAF